MREPRMMANLLSRSGTTSVMMVLPSNLGRVRPAAAAAAAVARRVRLTNACLATHHQQRRAATFGSVVPGLVPTRRHCGRGEKLHPARSTSTSIAISSSLAGQPMLLLWPPHQRTGLPPSGIRGRQFHSSSSLSLRRNDRFTEKHKTPSSTNHKENAVTPGQEDLWDLVNEYDTADGTYSSYSYSPKNDGSSTDDDDDDGDDNTKSYSSSRNSNGYSTDDNDSKSYVSPMQDFWDTVEANCTTLGLDELDDELNEYDHNQDSETATAQYPPRVQDKYASHLKCGIPDMALRFTTTSYGRLINAPYVHSQEHQVTLKVNTRWVPLKGMEWDILREIVGPRRFNEERRELRLTSDRFGSRIENKRHLVSMLDRIVTSCQHLGRELAQQLPTPPPSTSSSTASGAAAAASSSTSSSSSTNSSSSPS